MTTVDITLGENNSDKIIGEIPFIPYLNLQSNNIKVIHGFIKGTDSNEWLLLAEKEFSNLIKQTHG